ncbi:hypothetical protein CcCBS67573_g10347, partial [Chytriomyces confervae]
DFARVRDLQRHERSVHGSKKEFICSECGGEFARRDSLQRHIRNCCVGASPVDRTGLTIYNKQLEIDVMEIKSGWRIASPFVVAQCRFLIGCSGLPLLCKF